MDITTLHTTALNMIQNGKGLLAADESTATIGKRFAAIQTQNTPQARRDWRELLFRSEPVLRDYISGVILYEETLTQAAQDGTKLTDIITAHGAVIGIKVDKGTIALAGHPGEMVTEGLDGLNARLTNYYEAGARFAKWRAVIRVDDHLPSHAALSANCHALARYASLCQATNIVPIIEPEVLMDGDHDIARTHQVTKQVLQQIYAHLYELDIKLEGTVLKPNMVVAGTDCANQPSREEVAERTLEVLKNTVPAAVPGIAFLSGGQDDITATAHLDAMNKCGPQPWALTFSYGRALQRHALQHWQGQATNVTQAQSAFTHRAHMNSLAAQGQWTDECENT